MPAAVRAQAATLRADGESRRRSSLRLNSRAPRLRCAARSSGAFIETVPHQRFLQDGPLVAFPRGGLAARDAPSRRWIGCRIGRAWAGNSDSADWLPNCRSGTASRPQCPSAGKRACGTSRRLASSRPNAGMRIEPSARAVGERRKRLQQFSEIVRVRVDCQDVYVDGQLEVVGDREILLRRAGYRARDRSPA